MHFLWFILIGACAGWLAGQIMQGGGYGLVGNIIVGVIGALIGGVLIGLVGFETKNTLGSLISATIGSIVLIFVLAKFGRKV